MTEWDIAYGKEELIEIQMYCAKSHQCCCVSPGQFCKATVMAWVSEDRSIARIVPGSFKVRFPRNPSIMLAL